MIDNGHLDECMYDVLIGFIARMVFRVLWYINMITFFLRADIERKLYINSAAGGKGSQDR